MKANKFPLLPLVLFLLATDVAAQMTQDSKGKNINDKRIFTPDYLSPSYRPPFSISGHKGHGRPYSEHPDDLNPVVPTLEKGKMELPCVLAIINSGYQHQMPEQQIQMLLQQSEIKHAWELVRYERGEIEACYDPTYVYPSQESTATEDGVPIVY